MPDVHRIAGEYAGRVRVLKIDVSQDDDILESFDVGTLPALLLFRDGQEVDRLFPIPGFVAARLRRMIDPALAAE